ncbi:nucleoside phosphorylase domain-containing protein, partial [Phaeosphaeriaceae sp. PMI808]
KRYLRPEYYTVGWISALPIELAAAEEMFDEQYHDVQGDPNDSNLYTLGRMGEHNVVIACLPAGETGTNSAAAVAVRMLSKFKSIRFGLMVGIGGGVPSDKADVRLGDVVVSQPHSEHGGVVQYDLGKRTARGFERIGYLNKPPYILLNALTKVQMIHLKGQGNLLSYHSRINKFSNYKRSDVEPDILFQSTYNHVGGSACELCDKNKLVKRNQRGDQRIMVHYGTIASGNQVMKNGFIRDKISRKLHGVLCFEMEAAGLMNYLPCLVIRGICDYADSHKNDNWQSYAAGTATAYAREVLSVIPTAEVAATRTV